MSHAPRSPLNLSIYAVLAVPTGLVQMGRTRGDQRVADGPERGRSVSLLQRPVRSHLQPRESVFVLALTLQPLD